MSKRFDDGEGQSHSDTGHFDYDSANTSTRSNRGFGVHRGRGGPRGGRGGIGKRKFSHSNHKFTPPSRPAPTTAPARSGTTEHAKKVTPHSLAIAPRRATFEVFTSNRGILELAPTLMRALRGRDHRVLAGISIEQLSYALNIAILNRMVQVSMSQGLAFYRNASRLKQRASGLQFPDVICKYIESVGIVELPTSTKLAPLMRDFETIFPVGHDEEGNPTYSDIMLDPRETLALAGRPIPEGDWALDDDWLLDYNEHTSRATRSGMAFRRIVDSLEGSTLMLVGYMSEGHTAKATVPIPMSEPEAWLGGCYKFRCTDIAARAHWLRPRPGIGEEDWNYLVFPTYESNVYERTVFFSNTCVHSFSGPFSL